MLRKILIGLGVLIALLQFPGFPGVIVRWGSLAALLAIICLLAWSKRGKVEHGNEEKKNKTASTQVLSVENVVAERKVTLNRPPMSTPETDTRKRKLNANTLLGGSS
ncbi:MAG: hypothetical protein Q7R54_01410 [bacterium]|nr:hypothetical protein [bacterium]